MDHSHHHAGMSDMGHPSDPAPPPQPPATTGPHSHGGSAHTMPITFYFGYRNMELLFSWLVIDSAAAMAVAVVIVFLLALGYEGLKGVRKGLQRKAQERLRAQCSTFLRPEGTRPKESSWTQLLSAIHLRQTVLHMLQVGLSYLLMLTAMTYNAYFGLALLSGAGIGYWLFGGRKAEDVESQTHDVNKVELHEICSGNSPGLQE
ncbi:high affinity copper uptake protein 1-like [Sorex fumeus]|uniref:high affinity copper uptake protein 1-like n=1 Tax=Sorex fumeus TaxID=62283 RepID=UPI0024AC9273|nr:high affinity copper uptake protein 1-like [Sorex fumeus]